MSDYSYFSSFFTSFGTGKTESIGSNYYSANSCSYYKDFWLPSLKIKSSSALYFFSFFIFSLKILRISESILAFTVFRAYLARFILPLASSFNSSSSKSSSSSSPTIKSELLSDSSSLRAAC
jgi:hypothetical protein